ncbi:MAG: MATE family efflux transporter [Clostridia bacterium]
MNRLKTLVDRDFLRVTLRLAVPIALQKLLISSFSMVDTVMVGRLGDTALAAVGIAGQWAFLMNVVFFGLTSGLAVFVSQYWGRKDMDGIHRAYGLALTTSFVISAAFMVLALMIPRQVVRLFTKDEEVVAEAAAYLLIAAFSYPASALSQVFSTVLCSTEQVKLPMYVSIVSVAANMALNALFMFGMGMGVRGAALGTLFSTWITPVVTYLVARRRKYALVTPFRRLIDWTPAFVKRYFTLSLPVLMNESLWALGTTSFNMIYGQLSTEFFAAITIFRSIEAVATTFFWGLCHAASVVVGKHVGAGDMMEAKRDANRFVVLGTIIAVGVGLLMVLGRPILLAPFEVSAAAYDYAWMILLIYGLEQGIRTFPAMSIVGIFRAGGDTRTGLLYDGVCLWLFALPVTLVCGVVLKLPLTLTYLLMLLTDDVPKLILCIKRLKSGKWIMPIRQ